MKIMNNYQEGAKGASLCASCGKRVAVTLTNETISLCEGLEEVENALVRVCDECGNMTAIPARSLLPVQEAFKKLFDSKAVSDYSEITIELKSKVDARKELDKKSEPDYHEEFPLVAAE